MPRILRLVPLALFALAACSSEPAPRAKPLALSEPPRAAPAPAVTEFQALEAALEKESASVTSQPQAEAFLVKAESAFRRFAETHPGTEDARRAQVALAEIEGVRGDRTVIAKLEAVVLENEKDEPGRTALELLVREHAERGEIAPAKAALARLEAAHAEDKNLPPLRALVAEEEKSPQVGAAAPPLAGKTVAGADAALADLRGKVVLVDFWATWCGPCRAELPNVLATYARLHERGFEVLGVSLDQDEEKLKAFVEEKKVPWPQIFDGKGWQNAAAQAWGIHSIPATFVVDRDGVVRARDVRGEGLARAIEEALK